MHSGLLRFFLLIIFVFAAGCAGDAAPPVMITDSDVRTEPDTSWPTDADSSEEPDVSEPLEDATDPTDAEISDVLDDASDDVEAPDDVENDIEDPEEDTDPPTPACTAHTECTAPELCLLNATSGNFECTVPQDCAADADCTAPETCVLDGSLNALRTICLEPAGSGELGDTCATNAECASNLCLHGQCATPCARPIDCSDDGSFICTPEEIEHGATTETLNVCTPKPLEQCLSDADCIDPERCVLKNTQNGLQFVCAQPPTGGQEPGSACTVNADCASDLCLDNLCMAPCGGDFHCDTEAGHTCEVTPIIRNGESASVSICQPPVECARNSECLLNEVCYIRQTSTEVQTHCKPPNVGGALPVGAACTTDESCASNLCLQGRFQKHCAPACTTNADCAAPAGSPVQYECKSVTFTLASGTDTANVCVAKAPTACTSQSQCATGTQCAVVTNAANNGLESVCIPITGGGANGTACTSDAQCNGQLCLNGTCSQPCTNRNQCGAQQLCRNNNVQKSGFSRTFQVCETPPPTPCSSNLECTDGVRICAGLTLVNDELQGLCTFPNPGGSTIGASCTTNNACHSNFCLSYTNQCTMLCTNNGQCGGNGQICTTYEGLGLCASSCINNSSCTAGQSCTVNENENTGGIDYVCNLHYGDGQLGADPATVQGCQSGFSLTITQGSTETKYCSIICNTNADCTGGVPGNPLTSCEPVSMRLSDGSTTTVPICTTP